MFAGLFFPLPGKQTGRQAGKQASQQASHPKPTLKGPERIPQMWKTISNTALIALLLCLGARTFVCPDGFSGNDSLGVAHLQLWRALYGCRAQPPAHGGHSAGRVLLWQRLQVLHHALQEPHFSVGHILTGFKIHFAPH